MLLLLPDPIVDLSMDPASSSEFLFKNRITEKLSLSDMTISDAEFIKH